MDRRLGQNTMSETHTKMVILQLDIPPSLHFLPFVAMRSHADSANTSLDQNGGMEARQVVAKLTESLG